MAAAAAEEANLYQIDLGNLTVFDSHDPGASAKSFELDDAIGVLEHVVGIREKKVDTENLDVDVEKQRLTELLKEVGRAKSWKAKSLQTITVPGSQNKKK